MPRPIRAWRPAGDIVAPSQAATRWSPVGIRTRVVGLIQLRGHVLKGGHGTRASRIRQRIVCDLSVELGLYDRDEWRMHLSPCETGSPNHRSGLRSSKSTATPLTPSLVTSTSVS